MMEDDSDDDRPLTRRSRAEIIEEGVRLGLPRDWLELLPKIEALPGRYALRRDQGDAFLVWKAQEYLVRTGRLAEADIDLLAEALEDAAADDGPRWLYDSLEKVMFLMAWPRRNYHQKVELDMAVDHLRACLEESPSMWLLVEDDWEGTWFSARFDAQRLDDELDLPEACPWPSLEELLHAAEERLEADNRRFR